MLRAVIFDLHGTLLADESLRLHLFAELAREEGIAVDAAWLDRLPGLDDPSAFRALFSLARRPLEPERLRRLLAEKSRRYRRALEAEVPLVPGGRAIFEEAARRLPVGVVATSGRDEARASLKAAGLFRRTSALITADDLPGPAPSAQAYESCLEALNRLLVRSRMEPAPARSVLVFEDSEAGIRAAREAGMKVAAVAHTQRLDRLAAAETHAARLLDFDLGTLERELF